jgi:myo-inositol-1(or 4)-monophosphatase
MDLDHMKAVALAAAYSGGSYIRSRLDRPRRIDHKGDIDLVTEADLGSERRIIDIIRASFPDHTILSEEDGLTEGRAGYKWVIDPLDGTTNFAHGLTACCVSIALFKDGRPLIGIVWGPFTEELFSAVHGAGAFLNGRRLSVSGIDRLSDSLIATGFPYNVRTNMAPVMDRLTRCLKASQGIRRLGSAALDMCYVAAGRFEAFWEEQLHPWDTAAGHLIVTEAGGQVTDFVNQPFEPEMQSILASNGRIHYRMLELLDVKETE